MAKAYTDALARHCLSNILLEEGFTDVENGALELLVEAVALKIQDIGSFAQQSAQLGDSSQVNSADVRDGVSQSWRLRRPGCPPPQLDDWEDRAIDFPDAIHDSPTHCDSSDDSIAEDLLFADGLQQEKDGRRPPGEDAAEAATESADWSAHPQVIASRKAARDGLRQFPEGSTAGRAQPQQTLWVTVPQDATAVRSFAGRHFAPFRLKPPSPVNQSIVPPLTQVAQPPSTAPAKRSSSADSEITHDSFVTMGTSFVPPKVARKRRSSAKPEISRCSPMIVETSPVPPPVRLAPCSPKAAGKRRALRAGMTQTPPKVAKGSPSKPFFKKVTGSSPGDEEWLPSSKIVGKRRSSANSEIGHRSPMVVEACPVSPPVRLVEPSPKAASKRRSSHAGMTQTPPKVAKGSPSKPFLKKVTCSSPEDEEWLPLSVEKKGKKAEVVSPASASPKPASPRRKMPGKRVPPGGKMAAVAGRRHRKRRILIIGNRRRKR